MSNPCPYYRFTLGAAEVTVVSDGRLAFPPKELWPHVPDGERDAFLTSVYQPLESLPLEVNALVVDFGGRRVLIDAGNGRGKFQPTAGALPENFVTAGLACISHQCSARVGEAFS